MVNKKISSIVMLIGGSLMVISSCGIMALTLMEAQDWTLLSVQCLAFVFLLGAVMFTVMQRMSQQYKGGSLTIRRLLNIQLISGICLIFAGLLMVENFCKFVLPFVSQDFDSQMTYLRVVHNNWSVLLLIGAIIQVYTAHRLGSEMGKDS